MNSKKSFFIYLGMVTFAVMVFMGTFFMGQAVVSDKVAWIATAEAATVAEATEVSEEEEGGKKDSSPIKYLAAALALGLGATGTAMAQMKIGAAGAGAMAEKPELATMFIVMIALPETIVILGFVVAAMIIMF